jgi:hypothetical protein
MIWHLIYTKKIWTKMIKTDKYLRIKSGEANFELVERFDDVKKAANPNAQGEVVECKINSVKIDFTKVKKEKDGRVKNSPSEVQGSSTEETRKVPGSKAKSI